MAIVSGSKTNHKQTNKQTNKQSMCALRKSNTQEPDVSLPSTWTEQFRYV
jgi:hypothetical protein